MSEEDSGGHSGEALSRRRFIGSLTASIACLAEPTVLLPPRDGRATTDSSDYHGYAIQNFVVEGCNAKLIRPLRPLKGNPWVWRTMFWDAFPGVDLALLDAGFHLGYVDVGNTFGCPDAMKHFDAFHATVTQRHGLARRPALEGLSRGGLYAYRWAYVNTDKVGCIYGDAPVCDMKSWPGGKGKGSGSPADWQDAIRAYHFSSEKAMMEFRGNPIDILAPIANAHIPILHVCGELDQAVPEDENTDVLRTRYLALGGSFALIVKQGCDHHPHGLADPTPIVDFIIASCVEGQAARKAQRTAPQPGSLTKLSLGHW